MTSRIAYVINQYPKISHTFIRREIHALERQGINIFRIALQGWDAEVTDDADKLERNLTRYVLQNGMRPLLWSTLKALFSKPNRFYSALILAIRMGRGTERALLYHLIYLAEACRILPWLKSFGATHVHAHFGTNSAEIAMLVNALGGPPFSFTVHGQDELLFGGIAEKVRRSKFTVAISSFGRSQLYRRIDHSSWDKVIVVHCGLEPSFYSGDAIPSIRTPRLVCVGRLSKEKGQLLLLEALHQLNHKNQRIEVVLAGDGEMRTELETKISEYGLGGQVRITGWLSSDQVREEILAARALILPSFSEGLPVVIMEAMSLRRPVLATYVGGIAELVINHKTGWLFPSGSVEDLMQAMESFISKSDDEISAMGEAAYLRVLERHSIDSEARKLAKLFSA